MVDYTNHTVFQTMRCLHNQSLHSRHIDESEPDSRSETNECGSIDRQVSSISSNTPLITNFLCITLPWGGALWANESTWKLLKVQSSSIFKSVVNVAAISTNPATSGQQKLVLFQLEWMNMLPFPRPKLWLIHGRSWISFFCKWQCWARQSQATRWWSECHHIA